MGLNRVYLIFAFLFSLYARSALGQVGSGDYFTTPDPQGSSDNFKDNQVYQVGDTIKIEWQTTMRDFSLLLWQDNLDKSATFFGNKSDIDSFNWTVALTNEGQTFNTTETSNGYGPSFFFAMYNETGDDGGTSPIFRTHSFNITGGSSSSVTTSATSTSQTPGAQTDTSSTPPPTTSATTIPTASAVPAPDNSSGGLSTGAQAGIGVGVSIAGLLAIAAAVFFIRSRRGRGSPDGPMATMGPYSNQGEKTGPNIDAGKVHQSQPLMSELGTTDEARSAGPSELAGSSVPSGPTEHYTPSTMAS